MLMNRIKSGLLLGLLFVWTCSLPGRGQSASVSNAPVKRQKSSSKTAGKTMPARTNKTRPASSKGAKTRRAHGGSATRGARATRARGAATSHKTPSAKVLRLTSAFTASEQLRPMAQQLAASRSAQAYAGVQRYAAAHPGEAAAAADLATGHAYMLDRRYPEAVGAFRSAASSGEALGDYADYLGAQAAEHAGQIEQAETLLNGFADRHPESIFSASAPLLLANLHLQQNDAPGARRILEGSSGSPAAGHADFRMALGRAYQQSGDTARAVQVFRQVYSAFPLGAESTQAAQQLDRLNAPLTANERKSHADQLFNAKRYSDAAAEYHALQHNDGSLSSADRDALDVYAAVCDLRLKRISRRDAERLPTTTGDSAAAKAYILAELSRSEGNRGTHDELIAEMVRSYPTSRWLEEALYSGGNMYLLLHDPEQAIRHYQLLVSMFPESTYAPSAHWRTAWMNYRLRRYDEAARLMDEQVERYAGGIEIPSALYWRARILEDEEHDLPQAANYYHALSAAYANFYYAGLARQRLAVIGEHDGVAPAAVLSRVRPPVVPDLTGALPEDDEHLIKARLLANAALNEYIAPEIQASPSAGEWGALAQAQIYSSFGEVTRSLQSIKHSGIPFFALPFDQVPRIYWQLLFPRPYWSEITTNSQTNGLDPYLVASLIRQESEFNAGVVSHANAYGLMQLLPSVGKSIAKKHGLKGFNAGQLLVPAVNLQLGTINLREVLNRYGGQIEYALAAYNAGDVPVRQWMSTNDYKDIPEFVESIPYTETREYVQAILRNRELYRAVVNGHAG